MNEVWITPSGSKQNIAFPNAARWESGGYLIGATLVRELHKPKL
jgi:hypothetical protein